MGMEFPDSGVLVLRILAFLELDEVLGVPFMDCTTTGANFRLVEAVVGFEKDESKSQVHAFVGSQ